MANSTEEKVVKIIMNGKQAEASIDQITKAFSALNRERNKEQAGSTRYKELTKDLTEMNKRITTARNEIKNLDSASSKFWSNFKSMALGSLAGNFLINAVSGITGFMKGLITKAGELSDAYANIRKVTGLTMEGVKELDGELSKINTRTSRKELRELAVEAGKLGIDGVHNIAKFVKEADQIKVALGEDLGPEAITQIGRLSNIFKKSMLEIGSAINEIGAQSAATEAYQVDFLNRLAGTGPTVKLSADQLLGYSATLENMGQSAEVSGSALSKFFINFVKDIEKFGSIAGMKKGSLTEIFNGQGTNAAFIAFLENLKKSKTGTVALAQSLDQMGIDGARSTGVFLSLANSTEEVAHQQAIANKAITEGTSLTNEFNIKNETMGAKLEKVGKILLGWVMNNPFTKIFVGAVLAITEFISKTESATEAMEREVASLQDQQYEMNASIEVLKQGNLSQEHRKRLIDEINSKYDEYLPHLISEKDSIQEIADIQEKSNKLFLQKIIYMQYQDKLTTLIKAQAAMEEKQYQNAVRMGKMKNNVGDSYNDPYAAYSPQQQQATVKSIHEITYELDKNKKEVAELKSYYDGLLTSMGATMEEISNMGTGGSAGGSSSSGGKSSGTKKETVKAVVKEQLENDPELQAAMEVYGAALDHMAADHLESTEQIKEVTIASVNDTIAQEIAAEEEKLKQIDQMRKDAARQTAEQVKQVAVQLVYQRYENEKTIQLNALEDWRNHELDNANLTAEDKTKIDQEYNDQKRAIQMEAAKKEKDLALFQIGVETAVAAVKALTQDPTGVLSAWVLVQGGLEAALVASRPLPQFAYGGATVAGESGQYYQASNVGSFSPGGSVNGPAYGIIGEKGPEYVIPNWLYKAPAMANTMRAIESMVNGGTMHQYYAGGPTASAGGSAAGGSPDMNATMRLLVLQMGALNEKLENGILAKTVFVQQDYEKFTNRIDQVKEISKL